MASLVVFSSLICMLVFVVSTSADDQANEDHPWRSEWWREQNTYKDAPRLFNQNDACTGTRVYLDCNSCSCHNGKIGGCTRMACLTPPQIPDYTGKGSCPAGRQFYAKCNTCTCNADGNAGACTRMACPIPNSSGKAKN